MTSLMARGVKRAARLRPRLWQKHQLALSLSSGDFKIEIAAAKAREPRRSWLSDYSNLRDSGLSGKISRPRMAGASAANVWRDTVILRSLWSGAPRRVWSRVCERIPAWHGKFRRSRGTEQPLGRQLQCDLTLKGLCEILHASGFLQ